MAENKTTKETKPKPVEGAVAKPDAATPTASKDANGFSNARRVSGHRPGGRGGDRRGGRGSRDGGRSEFEQKLIGIRRVARVMAGGRRFKFSVTMVIGDKKGRVGVGVGKAADTALAIEKAMRDAKRKMITIDLTKNNSIKRNIGAKYCASVVDIRPSPGRGLVAGAAVRAVLELGGVSDVTAKILSRSKNSINNARATIDSLKLVAKK